MHTAYPRPRLWAPAPGRPLLFSMAIVLVVTSLLAQRPLELPRPASSSPDESGYGIAVDQNGTAHITGIATSQDFPLKNPIDGQLGGPLDAFVTIVSDNMTWYVAPSGNDANDCLSSVTACLTIGAAISKASAGDTISIAAGTYAETDIVITKDLTLAGAGANKTTIDGTAPSDSRVIDVRSGTVRVSGVTIWGGNASAGGGVANTGILTLYEVVVTGNIGKGNGAGGIFNTGGGKLTLLSSAVSNNVTISETTAMTGTVGRSGGGIYNDANSTMTIVGSTISGNRSGNGAGIFNAEDGTITISGTTILNNQAESSGGGIYNDGTLTIRASTIGGNIASRSSNAHGGGILNIGTLTLKGTVVRENTASAPTVGGGGILNIGTLTMDNSQVISNTITGSLADGGGISNNGTLTLKNDSRVSDNSVTGDHTNSVRGGGISNETDNSVLTLIDSTVSNNTVTNLGAPPEGTPYTGGGGISSFGSHATLVLTRSHILDNSVSGVNLVWGGGILANGTATLDESTVRGNHVNAVEGYAAGIFVYNDASVDLYNSAVISNTILGSTLADGGGITALNGRLKLVGSTVRGNRAEGPRGQGGGMNINVGSFTLIDSHIDGNYATSGAGGITNGGTLFISGGTIAGNSAGSSGGMSNQGTAVLSGTQVLNNSAVSRVGGIQNIGTLTLIGASISGNTAGATDAGISNQPAGILTIVNSLILDNNAGGGGGGIVNYGDTIADGIVSIDGSTISGNHANSGAAIGNTGRMTITNSNIISNRAEQEAGIFNGRTGELTMLASTVSGNAADIRSGGLFNAGKAWIGNSTISGNSAGLDSGGIRYDGVMTSTLVITNTTITGNTAGEGGGINVTAGQVTLQSTLLAGNHAASGPDCMGALGSQDYNLVGDAAGCAFAAMANDQIGTVTISDTLGPLADNGGPTPTHALLPGSPAIDKVPTDACPPTDQRGVARPYGPFCDIGAYELNAALSSGLRLADDI